MVNQVVVESPSQLIHIVWWYFEFKTPKFKEWSSAPCHSMVYTECFYRSIKDDV